MQAEPDLTLLASDELLPVTLLVFGSLTAASWTASYAAVTGSWPLLAAGIVSLAGSMTGLGLLDTKARQMTND